MEENYVPAVWHANNAFRWRLRVGIIFIKFSGRILVLNTINFLQKIYKSIHKKLQVCGIKKSYLVEWKNKTTTILMMDKAFRFLILVDTFCFKGFIE